MIKLSRLFCISCLIFLSCKKQISNNAAAQKANDPSISAKSTASSITAVPATYFDSLFTRYNKGEWTGGDVAYSHLLPDCRSFWLFGDSFVDTVYPNRHRPIGPFIHSVIVLTNPQGLFNTLYNGTVQNPKPFFEAEEPHQLWPNCAFISKDEKH
ncbi:MAG: hypothetical protein ABJA79_08595, partial [Parafilimonas sp.]